MPYHNNEEADLRTGLGFVKLAMAELERARSKIQLALLESALTSMAARSCEE